ncbi:uncharacterized protein LOC110273608 [Arachis duranensis]|uniref:Uncharacterized protein LOC110273608 n=1 Tax=Arachis duranensis TaxID=130453 RepID=A0A9C6T5Q1_ARADU|nr:uncharacterized protein LOC110273608 [Arachis duranensis]
MPRKPRYNIIREPPKDAGTNDGTEETTVGTTTRGAQTSREETRDRVPPISSSANRAPATRMNEPFRAPRIDHRNAQSSTTDDPQTPTDNIETRHRAEVADHELADEDYDLEADEVPSFDDHIDDLFAAQEVEGQHNNKKAKDTDFWEVTVIEDGVRKVSKLSVKEAIALPSNTKIVLPFNSQLQSIGQAAGLLSGFIGNLGADYSQFPIYLESWKLVSKAKRDHAYNMLKRVFYYEDDTGGKIKRDILKRIGKNWKDSRHHLFHRCYKQIRTYEENLRHHPKGIDKNNWKKFVDYRLNEETQEREQGRPISQNDSLAQVLGKEHLGRVRALGAGPCPTQIFGNAAGIPSGSAESNAEDKRMIAELTAKLEEERAKRQSIYKVLGYVVQQLGGNLPVEIAEELAFVGGTPDSSCVGPSSSGNHDPQQKL